MHVLYILDDTLRASVAHIFVLHYVEPSSKSYRTGVHNDLDVWITNQSRVGHSPRMYHTCRCHVACMWPMPLACYKPRASALASLATRRVSAWQLIVPCRNRVERVKHCLALVNVGGDIPNRIARQTSWKQNGEPAQADSWVLTYEGAECTEVNRAGSIRVGLVKFWCRHDSLLFFLGSVWRVTLEVSFVGTACVTCVYNVHATGYESCCREHLLALHSIPW
jgi:hypothetical protein